MAPREIPAESGLLAAELRKSRERALLTQEELAQRAGLSVGTVRGLETGRIQRPRLGSVRMLADALTLTEPDRAALIALARGEPVSRPDDEPAADESPAPDTRPVYAGVRPAQLPAAVPGFAGRAEPLRILDDTAGRPSATMVIAGTAGVGKTTLAVHWAQRARDRFPDGQLYVNLRGFHPTGSPLDPAVAVRGFLDALQVPPQRIPATEDAQTALYRSLLADRRLLVVLDNARDAEQVRPLLPGSPGCMVVVTSRDQLSSLVAAEGAQVINLNVLSADEARDLLRRRLGDERVTAEPQAADDLVAACARLPLALAVLAARAAIRPDFPLAALTGELSRSRDRLAAFSDDSALTDVRAVFTWSYRTLSDAAARLFRLLGVHAGPDIDVETAARLATTSPARVRPLLAELARAHLINEPTPGRYAFHDLLRAYAAELAAGTDSDDERREAIHRVLDYYLRTAHAAALLLLPSRKPLELPPLVAGVAPYVLADLDHAKSWLSAEHATLLAAVEQAFDAEFDRHAWQLAWSVQDFLERQGRSHDLATASGVGLRAAIRLGDTVGQAYTHLGLSLAYLTVHRLDEARAHLLSALDGFTAGGDLVGQANISRTLGWVLWSMEHRAEGLGYAERAQELYERAGDRVGQARAMNNLGWLHTQLDDHNQALDLCLRALAIQREIGDRRGETATWHSLGYVRHRLGDHQEAIACYERSADLAGSFDARYPEAEALNGLGDAHHALGDRRAARTAWTRALAILTELEHSEAADLRAKLRSLDDGQAQGEEPSP
ncbi:tetratricopeptide repeat protein [Nonomuraea sp. NPDC046802]|uniref:ATP-binding protein n=1 Tax=Nonomuraea sp. NPDC046802 TaxID=3154919 RepID=UPI00340C953D